MARSVSVLIVDGAPRVRDRLRVRVHVCALADADSGTQMRERIEAELPDIVKLDPRLPGEDGLALARCLRERCDVGTIKVTAPSDVIDRVVGLEVGAEDNVAKPFDPRELLARVKSVLRRLQARPAAADEAPALAGTASASSAAAMAAAAASAFRQRVGRCELDQQSRRLFHSGGPEVIPSPTASRAAYPQCANRLRVCAGELNRQLSRPLHSTADRR